MPAFGTLSLTSLLSQVCEEKEMSNVGKGKQKNQVNVDVLLEKLIRLLAPGEVWDGNDSEISGNALTECHTMLSQMDCIRHMEGISDVVSELIPPRGEMAGSCAAAMQEWMETQADMVVDGSKLESLRKYQESNNIQSPFIKTDIQETVFDEEGHSKGIHIICMSMCTYMAM